MVNGNRAFMAKSPQGKMLAIRGIYEATATAAKAEFFQKNQGKLKAVEERIGFVPQ